MVSPVDKLIWCGNSGELPVAGPLQGKICLPVHVLYECHILKALFYDWTNNGELVKVEAQIVKAGRMESGLV